MYRRVIQAGLVLPLAAFATADVLNPAWSPVETTISHYAHAPRAGWLIPAGLVLLAVTSAALTRRLSGPLSRPLSGHSRAGTVLLSVWTVAVLAGGIFPADPPGRWDQPPSPAGMLHATAALFAFTALPVAAVVLTRRWSPATKALRVTALSTVATFALFMVTFVDVMDGPTLGFGHWETMTGLAERLMLWSYVAWLAVAATRSVGCADGHSGVRRRVTRQDRARPASAARGDRRGAERAA